MHRNLESRWWRSASYRHSMRFIWLWRIWKLNEDSSSSRCYIYNNISVTFTCPMPSRFLSHFFIFFIYLFSTYLHDSISVTGSSVFAHGFAQELRERRPVVSVRSWAWVLWGNYGVRTVVVLSRLGLPFLAFIAVWQKAEVTEMVEIKGRIYGDPRGNAKIPPLVLFF